MRPGTYLYIGQRSRYQGFTIFVGSVGANSGEKPLGGYLGIGKPASNTNVNASGIIPTNCSIFAKNVTADESDIYIACYTGRNVTLGFFGWERTVCSLVGSLPTGVYQVTLS